MSTFILVIFAIGYAAIILEHPIRLNKAASALITGVLCWTIYIFFSSSEDLVNNELTEHLGEISGILFFLLGAMTIVELIDAHDGFEVITTKINTTNKSKLLWIICSLCFVLSAVLDNLTTTIVMVSLVKKLLADKNDRLFFCGMIIISANAGGAWSPIGDVTTTMLWIGGQLSTSQVIASVILPSLACMVVPLLLVTSRIKGTLKLKDAEERRVDGPSATVAQRNIVFFSGVGVLIFVPTFKTVTHLPPYMGMLMGLGIIWVITEIIHSEREARDKSTFSVLYALRKIDSTSILFFLGILLAVGALESIGVLHTVAEWLDESIGNETLIVSLIGLLSAVVDNVPLVAAAMGMYDMTIFPVDDPFWLFLAYCAGTGGSVLVIGSAAGVAAMGIEKIHFFWYAKHIAYLALIGYVAGIGVFILQQKFLGF